MISRALAALLLFFTAAAQTPDRAEIDRTLRQLSEVTGFSVKRPVPTEAMTREQWKVWLEQELKRRVKPEEIRRDELVLKKFGLVPPDFDLKKTTVDLLTEQAAAFYDHRKKKMVFVQGGGASQDVVLAHELAHALADQHFSMTRFVEASGFSDDAQTARLAVVEGQATWLMMEIPLRAMGASLTKNRAPLDMIGQSSASSGLFPVFDNAPLYLRETLLFPYRDGVLFQQALVEKWGQKGFSEPLRRAPAGTQQILHPEAYFENRVPLHPPLPAFKPPSGFKRIADGSFGELDLKILLQQYGGAEETRRIAPGWRGGQFDLWEARDRSRSVLRWSLEFDSGETAAAFLRQYKSVLAGKWKQMPAPRESAARLEGEGGDGCYLVRLLGSRVEGLEGLPAMPAV
jgi:hypothetical protein